MKVVQHPSGNTPWNNPSIFLKHFSAHYLCSSRLIYSITVVITSRFQGWPNVLLKCEKRALPSQWALNSESSAISLSFSLVLWIRLSKVTPICSSLSLYSFNKVPESKDSRLFSSLLAFSKNTASSAKAIPCMQASTPSLFIGWASLALLNNAQRHRLWYLDSIAIMYHAASFANKAVSWSSHAHSETLVAVSCKPSEPAGWSHNRQENSLI